MSLQIFFWSDFSHQDHDQQRTYYKGFTLQDTKYQVGDCVYLFPESDGIPLYLGRIHSAFADCSHDASDAHCIEVRWFERFKNLEPNKNGVQTERELIELEDADVNPIGCLAGKANVFRAKSFEEAEKLAQNMEEEWFFCRGVFKQASNEFVLYGNEEPETGMLAHNITKRRSLQASGPEDMADSDDFCAARAGKGGFPKRHKCPMPATGAAPESAALEQDEEGLGLAANKRFCKGPGKQCVECGATQTPQWREGPAGPKTLCNACGVRYNRLRSSKRNGTFGPRQSNARSKSFKNAAPKEPVMTPAAPAPPTMIPALTHLSTPEQYYPQQQQQQQQLGLAGRPMRQAAVLAANRNAAFARTGVFISEDDGLPNGMGTTLSSGSGSHVDDSSHNSSESAEELFLQTCNAGQPQGLMSAGSSLELPGLAETHSSPRYASAAANAAAAAAAAAAANMMPAEAAPALIPVTARSPGCEGRQPQLVSETCRAGMPQQGGNTYLRVPCKQDMAPAPGPTSAAAVAAGNILRSVALRAVGYCPDVAEFGEIFASFERIRGRLPDEVVAQLLGVTEQVDHATNDAAAADAALAAVMQVMAARQKAADTARERAANATDKLKGCMADLLKQHMGEVAVPQLGSQVEQHFAQTAMLDGCSNCPKGMSWSQLDQEHEHATLLEHVSLLESNSLGGGLDSGAALIHMDCGFDSSLIKVQN